MTGRDYGTMLVNGTLALVGTIISALAVVVFMNPFEIAPSGVTGVAVLANALFGLPLGLVAFLGNIPILLMAWKLLPNGRGMVLNTLVISIIYAVTLDVASVLLDGVVLSDDRLLNAIFGGVSLGLGGGLIFRSGGSVGGTATLALIIQNKTGMSMSSVYMYTDTLVIGAAGLVFGLEGALYALVVLFITGLATDYVMEGPSVIRTATIVTTRPEEVAQAIMYNLRRGVTQIPGRGMYSGAERPLLYVTLARHQSKELVRVVMDIDEDAFVVIGVGHTAYGAGFKPPRKRRNGIHQSNAA